MKVVQVSQPGGPEALQFGDRPVPEPGPGQVRVRAQAIGVGKPDSLLRQGIYRWMPPLPATPGNEMAGVVDALGPGVTGLAAGQRVLVSARELAQRGGCYAESFCLPAAALYLLPDSIAAEDAVTLPNYQLAGALLYEAGVSRPQSVLILGAAGGVPTALAQLAAADGIDCIGAASSAAKCDFARAAGLRVVIDRSREDLAARVASLTAGRGVDVVLDPAAGPESTRYLDLLAVRGTWLCYGVLSGFPDINVLAELRRLMHKALAVRCYSIHLLDSEPAVRRRLMQRAIDLMAAGRLRPPAPTVMPLDRAADAHRLLDAGQVLGKLVLIPGP